MDDEENYVTRLKSQTTLYYDTLFYGKHFHQRPRQRNNHKDDEKVVLRNVLQEIADDYLGAVGDYDTTSTPSLAGLVSLSFLHHNQTT